MTDEDLIALLRSQIGDDVQHVYDHEALFRISADRIEALKADTVKLLDEANRDYNRKTNDLIARHVEQVAALVKERNDLIHDLERIKDSETEQLNRAERLEALVKDAFAEGFAEGGDGSWIEGDYTPAWEKSDARAALTQKDRTDG